MGEFHSQFNYSNKNYNNNNLKKNASTFKILLIMNSDINLFGY